MGVALVTGGSRGIGRVICETLARAGFDIVTCYSGSEEAAAKTVSLCQQWGVNAKAYKANVSSSADVEALFNSIKEDFGSLDVLVNNAGITKDGLLIKMSEEDFDAVLDTNLKGAFLCTKAAVAMMMKAKKGSIINISSVVGLMGNPGQTNYAASKAGLVGLAKSVAKEYGKKGIRVNVVAPGFIATDMTDALDEATKAKYLEQIQIKRFGQAQDVANLVSFLAGEAASYITGQVIAVDGGLAM